ncbi:MAG: VWA domain-containing protein [Desulfocapsaceae bacterium]|nr:VWA domain-containing protein [Desulfocapsaceae bacterium]
MTFAQPLWILAGLIVCVGTLFLMRSLEAACKAALEKFAAPHLLPVLTRNVSSTRQAAKKTIFLLALFCCFLALARPQYGFQWEDVNRKGIDILFALDTSKSMLTQDIKPNRLERAKLAIMDFIDQLGGDRVGLMPFAGEAYEMCPLTGDYQAFENSLKEVDTNIVPKGGTNIAEAIRQAESVLSNEANYKLLVLITDGENLDGDALAAATEAAKKGMRIFTVGVGTKEGEIIPIGGGAKGFVKDEEGNLVVSHLDEATLTQIAEKGKGLYVPLGNQGQGLQTIYQQKLSLIPKDERDGQRRKVPLERFQWPLGAAAVLLALEFMIGTRKSGLFGFRLKDFTGRGKDTAILLLAASLLSWPASSHGSEGETAYDAGNYPKAAEFYGKLLKKHPDDPKILFNSGAAAYKNNQYDDAIAAFDGALKSPDLDLQEKAYYNRGNAQFKKGGTREGSDDRQTLELWKQAIDSYKASLALNPDSRNAAANLKLVQQAYDELKKKEEQKQQDQQQTHQTDQSKKDRHDTPQKQQDQSGQQSPQGQRDQGDQPGQQVAGTQQQAGSRPDTSNPRQPDGAGVHGQDQTRDNQAAARTEQEGADNERRKEGKMTREDAEQLLNSMKNDEGKMLNFAPSAGKDEKPGRDW